jgi:integrase
VQDCAALGNSESTLSRYKPIFRRFKEHIGAVRARASVASLTVSEVEGWRNVELLAGVSGTTANLGVGVIRAALNSAKRRGEILHNPCDAVLSAPENSDDREPFSDAEIVRLLKAAKDEWRGCILTAAWTGLRLADVAGLTWDQIDTEHGTVSVVPNKTGKRLLLKLADEVIEYLDGKSRGVGKAPLFPSLHGRITGSNGGLSNEFARLMQTAEITVGTGRKKKGRGRQFRTKSFHSLRHSFLSRLTNADVPQDVRKALAGHDSDAAHERYCHLDFAKQGKSLSKLAKFGGWI